MVDTGYRHCACRDCFEVVIGDRGTYCDDCITAGCPDNTGSGQLLECAVEQKMWDCDCGSQDKCECEDANSGPYYCEHCEEDITVAGKPDARGTCPVCKGYLCSHCAGGFCSGDEQ